MALGLLFQKGEENGSVLTGKARELGSDFEPATLGELDVNHSRLGLNQLLACANLELQEVALLQPRADFKADARPAEIDGSTH